MTPKIPLNETKTEKGKPARQGIRSLCWEFFLRFNLREDGKKGGFWSKRDMSRTRNHGNGPVLTRVKGLELLPVIQEGRKHLRSNNKRGKRRNPPQHPVTTGTRVRQT